MEQKNSCIKCISIASFSVEYELILSCDSLYWFSKISLYSLFIILYQDNTHFAQKALSKKKFVT